jgi:hypothetical protein
LLYTYATHKHPKVKAWLVRHPRFVIPLHPEIALLAQCGRDPVLEADPAVAEAGRIPLDLELQAAINPKP